MLLLLVLALAVTGALLAADDRGWLTSRGVPPGRRVLYGAAAGAAAGLLLIPVLGLVVALVFFVVAVALLAAIALGVVLLMRSLSGRRT